MQANPLLNKGVDETSDKQVIVLFVNTNEDEDDEDEFHFNDVLCSKATLASLVTEIATLKREQTKLWEQIRRLRRYPYAISPFVTTTELDQALALRKGTATKLVNDGRIKAHVVGSHLFVLEEDVLDYVRACPVKAA